MKKLLTSTLLMLVISLFTTAYAGPLNGTWELVSGEYVDDKGALIQYKDLGMASLKVISDTHYSFISMKGDKFWASGAGTYKLDKGTYTETIKYTSYGDPEGKEYKFEAKLEKGFWYNSRTENGKRIEYEVWRKLDGKK